jgi:hypothetical protein
VSRALGYDNMINKTNASPLRPFLESASKKPYMDGSPLVVKQKNNSSYLKDSPSPSKDHSELFSKSELELDRIEKGEIAKVWKDTIFLERELESSKIELCLKPDFNLPDATRLLNPY